MGGPLLAGRKNAKALMAISCKDWLKLEAPRVYYRSHIKSGILSSWEKGAVGFISRLTIGDLFLIDSQDVYLGFLRQTGFIPKIRNKSRLYIYLTRFVSNWSN